MNKAVKKLRKLKDQLDKIEEKEDDILSQIDEAIEELNSDEVVGNFTPQVTENYDNLEEINEEIKRRRKK